jgi:IMP dehydrogenase
MNSNLMLSFDDVLIKPQFSSVFSRKDVDVSQEFCGMNLSLPVISSNMDTVTGPAMANAMKGYGAVGALHRFMSIQDNITQFLECSFTRNGNDTMPIVSVGLGKTELARAEALYSVGANVFLIDVAHGASMQVIQQVQELRKLLHHSSRIIVGNFATGRSILDFNYHLGSNVEAYKVGIGGGSACLTRVVTGCGLPTLASVIDCASVGFPTIADGGIRNSGDVAKALGAGATTVMIGRLFAGCEESPGQVIYTENSDFSLVPSFKRYRGSASTESYQVQGKIAPHRSYEGDAYEIPYTGPVKNTLQQIEGGLRSALSYVGATNLQEFRECVELVQVTGQGAKENGAHGKSNG